MDGAYTARMYLGAHNIWQDEETQVEVASHDFQIHENYDSITLKNDIAYIRFPSPVAFSKKNYFNKTQNQLGCLHYDQLSLNNY